MKDKNLLSSRNEYVVCVHCMGRGKAQDGLEDCHWCNGKRVLIKVTQLYKLKDGD